MLNKLSFTSPSPLATRLFSAPLVTRHPVGADLIAENALLRQQLIVLHRQIKNAAFTQSDHLWLVLLASRIKLWKKALLIFKPDTLLRWHRQGFRLFCKFKSHNRGRRPKLDMETITLIQQIARENRLWGGQRICGELLTLGLIVAKHTIQTYIVHVRPATPTSQTWSTFLKIHAKDIWACDFRPIIDLWFRPLYLLSSSNWLHGGSFIVA